MAAIDLKETRRLLGEMDRSDPACDDVAQTFYPCHVQRRVLEPRGLIVVGERGDGKSALCRFLGWLTTENISEAEIWPGALWDEAPPRRWLEAYAEIAGSQDHPTPDTLEELARAASPLDLRRFWRASVVRRLVREYPDLDGLSSELGALGSDEYLYDPHSWVLTLGISDGALTAWLDRMERRLASDNQVVVLTYDAVDRVTDLQARQRLVGALFAAWLSLTNRYRRISTRIFVRPDVLESALGDSADASKLSARARWLSWDRDDLFGLLARRMAAIHPKLHDLLAPPELKGRERDGSALPNGREQARMRVTFERHPHLGLLPRLELNGRHESTVPTLEARVTYALAGPVVGVGLEKQDPALWIGTKLADAHSRITPRSLLALIAGAARHALRRKGHGGTFPLDLDDLKAGLEHAAKQRRREIIEDHKVVARLEELRDIQLPTALIDMRQELGRVVGRPGDTFGTDGARVLDELERLGVISIRTDGRVDVSEIYRLGTRLRRRVLAP